MLSRFHFLTPVFSVDRLLSSQREITVNDAAINSTTGGPHIDKILEYLKSEDWASNGEQEDSEKFLGARTTVTQRWKDRKLKDDELVAYHKATMALSRRIRKMPLTENEKSTQRLAQRALENKYKTLTS